MAYYKMIRDGSIINVGCYPAKWIPKHGLMCYCELPQAMFIHAYDGSAFYHADWMRPVPSGTGAYELADVIEISFEEFAEYAELLSEGETVTDPEPDEPREEEPAEEPQEDSPEEERPMTIEEMRQKITEQAAQIEMLTECLLEMSEILYGGTEVPDGTEEL